MSKHYGELTTEVLRWALDALSSLKRKEKVKILLIRIF